MTDSLIATLRGQFQAISLRLDQAGSNAEREAAKREIIAYFKKVDSTLGELTQLKEDIRGLVDRYKQLQASTDTAQAPQFTGARPMVHADHIGASTFIEKGWSLISLGDYAGAIQSLGKALQLSPADVQAQSLLGWAQMLHEDYDDALATFSKVLMKEPANSLARINVGYICLKKRIFGEAIEHLSKAIRLDNDRKATLYAHYYLGLVYLEREMFEDAQTFFQKTLNLGPNLIEAYFELGRASWFMGDKTALAAPGKRASRPTSSIRGANAVRKCSISSPPEESRRARPPPDLSAGAGRRLADSRHGRSGQSRGSGERSRSRHSPRRIGGPPVHLAGPWPPRTASLYSDSGFRLGDHVPHRQRPCARLGSRDHSAFGSHHRSAKRPRRSRPDAAP